ncbi:MAG: hypothetical protein ACLTDI_12650 [Acutalibacteraceae bacterium]
MQNDTGWWYARWQRHMAKRRLGISVLQWLLRLANYFDPKGYMKDGWIEIGRKMVAISQQAV